MRRWLPYPVLWALLAALWLTLNRTVAPGQVLLGALLALGATLAFAALQPPQRRIRARPVAVARFLWVAISDMVRSNLAMARLVLYRGTRRQTSAFVTIPLEVSHPAALAVLAVIFTATPGTAWARYDRAGSRLTIHVLDLVDEEGWIEMVKQRYERRLLEIFE